jgi:hypothetical protein
VADHDEDVLRGMSHGPWCLEWANNQEEKGISRSGGNDYDDAPEAPAWARRWARDLADSVVEINGLPLAQLYVLAANNGYPHGPEQFGSHLALQSIGCGVSWTDDVRDPKFDIKLPGGEFYQGAKPDLRFVHSTI